MQGLSLKHLSQYQGTFLQSLVDVLSITQQCWSSFSPGLPDRPLPLPQENLQTHCHSLDISHSSYPDSHWKLNPDLPGCFSNWNNREPVLPSRSITASETGRTEMSVFSFPLPINFQSAVFPPVFSFLSYSHTCTLEQLWSCTGTRGIK